MENDSKNKVYEINGLVWLGSELKSPSQVYNDLLIQFGRSDEGSLQRRGYRLEEVEGGEGTRSYLIMASSKEVGNIKVILDRYRSTQSMRVETIEPNIKALMDRYHRLPQTDQEGRRADELGSLMRL